MPVKNTNLICTTGLKSKRDTSVKTSTSAKILCQSANMDLSALNASFSYASSDEEDVTTTNDKERQLISLLSSESVSSLNKTFCTKSFTGRSGSAPAKSMIKKISASIPSIISHGSDTGSVKSRFLPLSLKEKRKRANKLMKERVERQETPISPHLTLADLVRHSDVDGKKLYSDSWRHRSDNRHNSNNTDDKTLGQKQDKDQERDQNETLCDERINPTSSFFGCLLAAITSGGGCVGRDTNILNDEKSRELSCGEDTSIASSEENRASSTVSTTSNLSTLSEMFDTSKSVDKYAIPQQTHSDPQNSYIEATTLETCIDAINNEKWNDLIMFVNANPKLMTQTSTLHRKRNLLQILAGQHSDIPTLAIVTMINLCPESVSQTDQDGCVALHHMAFTGGRNNFVKILLDSWSEGTTVRNVDGDLPLHVSVWSGKGNENVANLLMNAHPPAVGVKNNSSGTPLHLACCENNASPVIVEKIIQMQLELDVPFNIFDNNGNTPLHVAIKTNAPLAVIKTISSELGSEPFSVPDKKSVYPLQMAMSMKGIDPEVVQFICTAAPPIMKKQMTNGMMPVCMAAEQDMSHEIVKQLLLADSPVKFMPLLPKVRDVVLRIHSHSWWHLAITSGKYASVIDDILSNMASIHEIVSLCQEPDLNGYSSLFEVADIEVKNVLLKNLLFCERYRVAPEYKATVVKGLLLLCADDISERNESQIQNVKSTENDPKSFSMQQNREVLLHCCVQGSSEYNELVHEMRARDKFDFSPLYSQKLFRVDTIGARKIGCTGEMLCLAFERPLLTLQEIFVTSRFRKRKNQQWARKSLNLLLSLARVLKYFHSVGYIHGSVEPSTIGKFQGSNNWKMLDMRRATQIGVSMRGELRYGAPPESISTSRVKTGIPVVKLVSFDENFVKTKVSSQLFDEDNEITQSLEFSPEQCIAATSWDIWSFGLILGQLVLGQSMVLLPCFEKASDAHLKNLHQYNDAAVKKISDAARRVSGNDAADLLNKLLQPRPEDRPQSMDEVLSFSYFGNN